MDKEVEEKMMFPFWREKPQLNSRDTEERKDLRLTCFHFTFFRIRVPKRDHWEARLDHWEARLDPWVFISQTRFFKVDPMKSLVITNHLCNPWVATHIVHIIGHKFSCTMQHHLNFTTTRHIPKTCVLSLVPYRLLFGSLLPRHHHPPPPTHPTFYYQKGIEKCCQAMLASGGGSTVEELRHISRWEVGESVGGF